MAVNDTITIRVDDRIEQAIAALTRGGASATTAIERAILESARRAAPAPPNAARPGAVDSTTLSVQRKLTREQLLEFAERGYIVIPDVVPPEILAKANEAVDKQLKSHPPKDGHAGPHFMFPMWEEEPDLAALLRDTEAFTLAEELTGDGAMEYPWQTQIAMTFPPYIDDRGMPHIDGGMRRKADEPPRTFTMLAGFFLTDQDGDDSGNLYAWPGTHRQHAEYFRKVGPDAFTSYPDIELPEREQVRAKAGDLLLKHYMVGHNVGSNTSDSTRRTIYFRLKVRGHDANWREIIQDPWHDFTPLRPLVSSFEKDGEAAK
ncbi:phytanoyl-CoA dioxygenase family protein [Amycolatopsis sp. OK19-0408]|uniref:Phytanoyl-CoA dioxygenase family protein n=1 Tax=Amycolatopsis iheyensis TaxID=2945988 RepID=A0A9X2SQK5_9PSEU|nr:phytanoyl-CoA dioxygenase family protein [Amycolatopsis iheyensis]MCR6488755.1 phytanoyl-CoA dioxygenase family protein [Amycolatopsis iheyensis]